jgi:SAM-dependent methyltransferase
VTTIRVSPLWLAAREPADAVARAGDLVEELLLDLVPGRQLVVHDLACGTGSMLRWLAPQLPGPQHWVCLDLDADLLAIAAREGQRLPASGSPVTVEVRQRDVTRLTPDEASPAMLMTASALLDLVTAQELDSLVAVCAEARCPALFTLSVTGRVELWPPHPLDAAISAAFNAHQGRRTVSGRRLLGPDAADRVVHAFRSLGYDVLVRASPWRLGAAEQALTAAWFGGWLAAACEHRPELVMHAGDYDRQRRLDVAAGRLRVLVDHQDVLARPPAPEPRRPVNAPASASVSLSRRKRRHLVEEREGR